MLRMYSHPKINAANSRATAARRYTEASEESGSCCPSMAVCAGPGEGTGGSTMSLAAASAVETGSGSEGVGPMASPGADAFFSVGGLGSILTGAACAIAAGDVERVADWSVETVGFGVGTDAVGGGVGAGAGTTASGGGADVSTVGLATD